MGAASIRANIGPYQLLREIGRGATGVVYLAEHRQRRRRTAVKVLRPELTAQGELLARFFADAQGTSALHHPAIVEVLACDVDTGGHAYVAMEPLAGQSLTALLGARGKLSFFEAASLAGSVAHALGAAHEHGIAHGDLKPDHLFLPDAPRGAVKVLDFGIGRLAAAAHSGMGGRTTPGPRGPRLYLSPEHTQGDGASGGVDHLSDIYSLGAILYAMLSGHPPFVVATDAELAAMQRQRRAPTLSSIERTVPRVLSELVQSMLDPSPRHRPQSAEAVIDILREVAPVPDPRRVTAVIPAPAEPLAAPPFPRSTVVLPAPVVPSPALLQTVKIPAPLVPRPPTTTTGLVRSPSRSHRRVGGPRAVVTATLAGLGIGLAALAVWIAASDPTPVPVAVVGAPASPLLVHGATTLAPAGRPLPPPPARAAAPSPSLAAAVPLARPAPPATTANAVAAPRVAGRKPRRATVRLSVVTVPAGADVCLGGSSDSVATTPDPLRLRRQRGPRQVVIHRPGYRTERISVPGDRNVRRAIELRPLATDDLHEPPPCR